MQHSVILHLWSDGPCVALRCVLGRHPVGTTNNGPIKHKTVDGVGVQCRLMWWLCSLSVEVINDRLKLIFDIDQLLFHW